MKVTKNQTAADIVKNIEKVFNEKGWNAVYAYLKIAKIKYKINVVEFGLETNSEARAAKQRWCSNAPENTFREHLASLAIKAKSGWSYNRLRAQEVVLLY